jgi:hypothetical protein
MEKTSQALFYSSNERFCQEPEVYSSGIREVKITHW